VVIDTSVWFNGRTCAEAILALGAGLADGHWSAQIVGELTRTRLWVGKLDQGRRPVSAAEYLAYPRATVRADLGDRRGLWYRAGRRDGAGACRADMGRRGPRRSPRSVVRENRRGRLRGQRQHAPLPQSASLSRQQRGELEGVVWITPDQIF
jgi:hypothetical protein